MALHTELWFPSVIWSGMFVDIDNADLKNYAYQRKKEDMGVSVSNYNGWQSGPLQVGDNATIDYLKGVLDKEISNCAKQVGLAELEIYNMWININPPHSYNHLHNHVGSVLSGVYYIDARENQGNIQFERTDNAECFIPEYIDKVTYFTSTRATYAAKTGAMYIFPSWLKHSVEGNNTSTDRISIAFNYGEKK
jgi:uncharacterized protein (TIGR02466 family)